MNSDNSNRQLPLWLIVTTALDELWTLRGEVIQKTSIPIIAGVLIGLVQSTWSESVRLIWLIFGILNLLVYSYLAVSVHRLVLKGSESVPRFGLREWQDRETRFAGWLVATYILFAAAFLGIAILSLAILPIMEAIGLSDLASLWGLMIILPGLYLLVRVSLVLPATALDERPTLRWAWELTEGNGWRLVFLLGLFPFVLGLPLSLIWGEETSLVPEFLFLLVSYFLTIVDIALLSVCYRELVRNEE